MQRRGINRWGSWLGIFAIAMLFIGPPIGQWRAQLNQQAAQARIAAAQLQVEHQQHAQHAHAHHGHGDHAADAGHRAQPAAHAHAASDTGRQLGALQLDHCGYCHLVASFAALPALPLILAAAPRALPPLPVADYHAPAQPPRRVQQARAPPLVHA